MGRVMRWVIYSVSVVAVVLVAALWIRSHFWQESFWIVTPVRGCGVDLNFGLVRYMWEGDTRNLTEIPAEAQHRLFWRTSRSTTSGWHRQATLWGGMGFTFEDHTVASGGRRVAGTVPCWFVFALTAIVPGIVVILRIRRWHVGNLRERAGLCRWCGYDLRASAGACPECGRSGVRVGTSGKLAGND
jgi:hypothetical protein